VKIASGPAARRPYFGVLEFELELMLEEWDPIGVYRPDALPVNPAQRTAQQHEYDDLVRPIIAHLMESDDQSAFTSALRAVLAADYGLEFQDVEADADLRSFAASAVGWWATRQLSK
jgi:hypothetical protein